MNPPFTPPSIPEADVKSKVKVLVVKGEDKREEKEQQEAPLTMHKAILLQKNISSDNNEIT
jgi:hypothetical protein